MNTSSLQSSPITPAAAFSGPATGVSSVSRPSPDTKPGRVMIVDDEPINIKLIQKFLKGAGYNDFITTVDSREAIDLIHQQSPDILILDVMMPHVSGLEILAQVRADKAISHLPVLIVTASTEEETKIEALELGATDFLHKPVKPTELLPRVRNALVVKEHHDQMVAYSKRLEAEVAQRTMDLVQSREEVIQVLACAAEYRDKETGNHVIRVGRYAGLLARQLGCAESDSKLIELAAILHDAGKIGIADSILLKPGKLTEEEFELMKRHCEFGERILKAQPVDYGRNLLRQHGSSTRSPVLRIAAVIARSHHERWDGSGYPDGLVGDEIPLVGRITAVADVFDALSSKRCYKDAMPIEKCVDIMKSERGKHFDPKVLDAFLAAIDEATEIATNLAD
ncbi:response regulator [Stieleria sp. JC731]|uniref:HD-GYP domain-containing protein n=2 Tax=Pirellulaceae TaxID=2691357 RepID=UPI001E3317EF|nr:HD domain-containing phosphohydrolase [Stieleria sp. JC731]MCC9599919.1 response regulator [Stieleria sp. JC731]